MTAPDYPAMIAEVDRVEPVPRRVRAVLAGRTVVDTTRALYVWEWSGYPQFYIPVSDVATDVLVDEQHTQRLRRGVARRHGLRVDGTERPACARLYTETEIPGLTQTLRFDWDAMDAWYEEDEQVFVHPRNPYTRVDALRSRRPVRISLEGVVLAESDTPVMVFETGLPTRYYVDRNDVDFSHLRRTDTESQCPYKGRTSSYWSIRIGDTLHADLAWAYDFPTRALSPIAGLVAFYNEATDITLDGEMLQRPVTRFSADRASTMQAEGRS